MFRDRFQECPVCRVALVAARSTRGCRACGGVWATEAVLTEMVREMHDGRETLAARFAGREAVGEPRGCPDCQTAMAAVTFETMPVERCERGHGVWLDVGELQRALEAAGRRPPRYQADATAELAPPGQDPWLWKLLKKLEVEPSDG